MELVGTDWHWHHVDMATRDLNRLAKHVKAHRLELYSSRKAAADAAGISKDTWRRVEEGLEVRDQKLAQIDKALGWVVTSCITIAEGGEPLLADRPGGSGTPAAVQGQVSVDALRRDAYKQAKEKLPAAPIGDVDAFIDGLVEVLRKAGVVKDDD